MDLERAALDVPRVSSVSSVTLRGALSQIYRASGADVTSQCTRGRTRAATRPLGSDVTGSRSDTPDGDDVIMQLHDSTMVRSKLKYNCSSNQCKQSDT